MKIELGQRSTRYIARALVGHQHYIAAYNMLHVYEDPVDAFRRYLFRAGSYPHEVVLRTPIGKIRLKAFTPDDLLTINEIFCRGDYHSDARNHIFVDFGSNIGVSAAYFLTRSREGYVYGFEPLPQNIERLKLNLNSFNGRFSLTEGAVWTSNGSADFGWEETGRYGGLRSKSARKLTVRTFDENDILRDILARHGKIDVLKIDVEGAEGELLRYMHPDTAARIRKIFVEGHFEKNPLSSTHRYRQYGSIARFVSLNEP
jgi:FkbM family methyltransferase